jgi:predicted RNase H-like HicB family nuclease
MNVTMHAYLEPTGTGATSSWWSESPDVPGFYAAAEHLAELIIRSEMAVREIVTEQSPGEPISFIWTLMDSSAPPSEADEVIHVTQEGKAEDNAEDATGPAVTLVA